MLKFASEVLFDSYEDGDEVTYAQARRAIRVADRVDLDIEREVGQFDRLAGEVTVTYVRR
jgi:hypothetical protein